MEFILKRKELMQRQSNLRFKGYLIMKIIAVNKHKMSGKEGNVITFDLQKL